MDIRRVLGEKIKNLESMYAREVIKLNGEESQELIKLRNKIERLKVEYGKLE